MFLSSRVHLASPGLTIFNTMDRESQSMAAALPCWTRGEVLLRSDQEVTFTLILSGALASGKPRDHGSHGKSKPDLGRDVAH